MKRDPARYVNRELSWLEFNQRVLDEAKDASVPLLERLTFLTITASNLDEFFKVRVGGLQMLAARNPSKRDPAGLSPAEQLAAISSRAVRMVADQYAVFDELTTALSDEGVRRLEPGRLGEGHAAFAERFFLENVLPIVTPMAVDDAAEFPLLVCGALNLLVLLDPAAGTTSRRVAILPLGKGMARVITIPSEERRFVLLEDLAAMFVERFFPGERIHECVPFRITRNADLSVREDMASDLLAEMEDVLDARKESACVRLEIPADASCEARDYLVGKLGVDDESLYSCPGPLDPTAFGAVGKLGGSDKLRFTGRPPQPCIDLDPRETMFEALSERNVLLSHPFDSFEPVLRLITEAADDPDVIAIKQVLYRTSRKSPIVAALKRAALNGKYVTVVVELKARFDEARNIEWARDLERAGAQVIYGVKGFKIHAKVCLVVRREAGGIRRYVHYGTGNYNESTARLYTDISYLSSEEELGADATTFFNAVNGYSQVQEFLRIDMAPLGLRNRLLVLIRSETERRRQGQPARIIAKMNSLADPALIDALYAASEAGVEVDLIVRGICCLRPGVPGLSENIRIVSIIDRFLEHSRIFYFLHGGDEQVLISSADCMPRNLDRRLELIVPIDDDAGRRRLIETLETCLGDTRKGRRLLADGGYAPPPGAATGDARGSQELLYEAARLSVKKAKKRETLIFEPHRSPRLENGASAAEPAESLTEPS